MIPISKIRVINQRSRNKHKFQEIISSISNLGLKKPITVSRREDGDDTYDLVCGQGRVEAYAALGQTEVPAIVIDAPLERRYLMSLVENLARRTQSTLELSRQIVALKERGHTVTAIAAKVDLSEMYVAELLRLFENGEERLIEAVERGEIPISVAAEIAALDDVAVQRALAEAYETGKLRGKALIRARKLVEVRRARGKEKEVGKKKPIRKPTSANDLVREYQRQTVRQSVLVKNAHKIERQLQFITTALRQLLDDEEFVAVLRGAKLAEIPKQLVETMRNK
ncbi:MAG TPA: ParB/RepB/Spo0J family partition protein [Kofleriaceae bacterium]|nr:ParB/RepB/Spo0J family partition protein [Kofleriaceae bacterium]